MDTFYPHLHASLRFVNKNQLNELVKFITNHPEICVESDQKYVFHWNKLMGRLNTLGIPNNVYGWQKAIREYEQVLYAKLRGPEVRGDITKMTASEIKALDMYQACYNVKFGSGNASAETLHNASAFELRPERTQGSRPSAATGSRPSAATGSRTASGPRPPCPRTGDSVPPTSYSSRAKTANAAGTSAFKLFFRDRYEQRAGPSTSRPKAEPSRTAKTQKIYVVPEFYNATAEPSSKKAFAGDLTANQEKALVGYMTYFPVTCDPILGYLEYTRHWKNLTQRLNKLGPSKSVEQWQTIFDDWQQNMARFIKRAHKKCTEKQLPEVVQMSVEMFAQCGLQLQAKFGNIISGPMDFNLDGHILQRISAYEAATSRVLGRKIHHSIKSWEIIFRYIDKLSI